MANRRILVSLIFIFCFAPSLFAAVATPYVKTNLVSDQAGVALITDPALVNAWGIAMSPTSPFWVANNGTSTSTIYGGDVAGSPFVKNALQVAVTGGAPTGTVFNGTSGFVISSGSGTGAARFIWATEAGNIAGWSPNVPAPGSTTSVIAATHAGSVYKGLAIGNNGVSDFLYAADFGNNKIDVYSNTFVLTTLAGTFTDPTLPAGYGPFNIQNIGGTLYVAYAQINSMSGDEVTGPGLGYVSKFDTNGNFITRLISNGPLNAPWGLVIAPASFGTFGSALLVGNFGDGTINAFNATTGAFLGTLSGPSASPIVIDGLWAIVFGNGGGGGDVTKLYFASGPNGENNGLFGKLTVGTASTITPTATTIRPTEGAPFSGAVAAFADSDGTGTYTATINWGDGNTTVGVVTSTGIGGLLVSGTHTYAEEAASLPVTVVITDTGDAATATANSLAIVADAPLSGTPAPFSATVGVAFTGTVATFTDADPAGTASDYTATINWGDGSPASAGVISGTGPFTVTGTHTYLIGGSQSVTVTINDVGGATTIVTSTATVGGAGPTVPMLDGRALLALAAALAAIALLLLRK
jgi:uncharacterized protein (TIGR03118 family)